MNLLELEELLKSYGIDVNEIDPSTLRLRSGTENSGGKSDQVSVKELRDYLIQLRKEQGIQEKESGKDCGINRDANPCGDASEY
jgi:hypothetical protein